MKKLTGTIILTAILLTHVAITVATEESYIFSSTEATPSGINLSVSGTALNNATQGSARPVASGSLFRSTGFYSIEEQANP